MVALLLARAGRPQAAGAAAAAAAAAASAAARSAPGCTSARTAPSPSTPARSRSARTSAPRSRRSSPRSCACRSSRIRLVMADTRPDARSTWARSAAGPRRGMAPQLRRAAAAAREVLLDLAAEHGKVDRAELAVAGRQGRRPARPSETFAFGELTKGQKLTKTIGRRCRRRRRPTSGRSPARRSRRSTAAAFVTGQHQYASDVKRPGMLFGKVLRPPTLQGRRWPRVDTRRRRRRCPASIVVHDGDFVGVAAPTRARRRAGPGRDPAPSGRPPTSRPSDELFTLPQEAARRPGAAAAAAAAAANRGSIADGLKAADVTGSKQTYTIAYIAHAPLEPRAAVAEWAGRQADRLDRHAAAVRRARRTGAGLRAVRRATCASSCPTPARATAASTPARRPSRRRGWPRRPASRSSWSGRARRNSPGPTSGRPASSTSTAACSKDGTLTAWEFHNYNSGGVGDPARRTRCPTSAPSSTRRVAAAPGLVPRAGGDGEPLRPRVAHGRAGPRACGIDPLEFRLKNLKDERLRAVLEAAADAVRLGQGASRPPGTASASPAARRRAATSPPAPRSSVDRVERAACRSCGS